MGRSGLGKYLLFFFFKLAALLLFSESFFLSSVMKGGALCGLVSVTTSYFQVFSSGSSFMREVWKSVLTLNILGWTLGGL